LLDDQETVETPTASAADKAFRDRVGLRRAYRSLPYTPQEMDRYVEAWSQPGASSAMINYYRASVKESPKQANADVRPISAPTLVIWGQRDRYLGETLAEPEHDDVPNLDRVERLADASHWVHHDEPERVNQLLIDFFA
jgi:epoxide hydrolase 4